jgi:hypothetical protein
MVPFQTLNFEDNFVSSCTNSFNISYVGEDPWTTQDPLDFKSGTIYLGPILPLSIVESTYQSFKNPPWTLIKISHFGKSMINLHRLYGPSTPLILLNFGHGFTFR